MKQAIARRSLLFCTLVLLLIPLSARSSRAADIDVAPGAVVVNAGDGQCSLREAILNANTDSDMSSGDCAAGSGADVIRLAAGTVYSITDPYASVPPLGFIGLPEVTSAITIEGNSAVIERLFGASDFRIFLVDTGSSLTLQHTTVRGGRTGREGAGIYNAGDLTLEGSTITGNRVIRASSGGGIYNQAGNVTLRNSVVSSNGANLQGGGIYNGGGTIVIWESEFVRNGVGGVADLADGGGIFNGGGTVTIEKSEFVGNGAVHNGGAILNYGGDVTIAESSFKNNTANTTGGVYDYTTSAGPFDGTSTLRVEWSTFEGNEAEGGSVMGARNAVITNSTFSGNTGSSGAIIEGSNITIISSTIADNPRNATGLLGTIWVKNSIVAESGVHSQSGCYGGLTDVGIVSLGFNLFERDNGCPVEPTDVVIDSGTLFTTVLGPLADNGGPTLTHALLDQPANPALDAASCTDADGHPLTSDQRGETRPSDDPDIANADGGCDIGAFELQVEGAPDETPPVCGAITVETDEGSRLTAVSTSASDPESGIALATFTRLRNLDGFLDGAGPFTQGDTEPFVPNETPSVAIRGERISLDRGGAIVVTVTNGAGLSSRCDPVIENVSAEAPESYVLSQNYPNPFTAPTRIAFALPEGQPVRLAVYDVLGREVAVLVDEELPAGRYEAVWDGHSVSGGEMASGAYFYRIEAGTFSATRQMTLLK